MRKRAIQIFRMGEQKEMCGFVKSTRKLYRVGHSYLIEFKHGTNKLYDKKWIIAKCTLKTKYQYLFEILNDGE